VQAVLQLYLPAIIIISQPHFLAIAMVVLFSEFETNNAWQVKGLAQLGSAVLKHAKEFS